MAKKKWKKIAKNVGKAAVLAGALYGASKLGKRGLKGNVEKTAAMEDANIGGITPEVFTLSGKCVLCPPYIFRPTTRFAYWMGILL